MDHSLPGFSFHGDSPDKDTGVGCHALLQRIFPTPGSNPDLPHHRQILYSLSYKGSPWIPEWVAYPFSRGSSWPRNWIGVFCTAGGFFTSFPGGSEGKESACDAGDLDLIPGLGRSLEKGMVNHSSIVAWRIPWSRGVQQATVHGVAKSWTWLSDFHFTSLPAEIPGKTHNGGYTC